MGFKARTATCSPEDILKDHAGPVIELANQARQLILGMMDGIGEYGYPGWKVIGFRRKGYFAFIAPRADHIRIGFEHGYALPDLSGILQGDGQVRTIEVRDYETLHSREVKTAISMALYDDDTHGFRSRALG